MVKIRFLGQALLGLACLAPLSAAAADKPAPPRPRAESPRSLVSDVVLTPKNELVGKVVDSQGRVVDGAAVVVRQGNRELARTMTDKSGNFSVANVRGGVYQIASGQGVGTYRVWTANAAPPAAKPGALVVSSPQVVRGQIGGGGAVLGALGAGAGAAGLGFGVAGYTQSNDAQDDADEANNQNQQLQQQINQLKASVD